MIGVRVNQKPACLGEGTKQYKQYTFFKEKNHEDLFTVFPPYREAMEQAQAKIPFFKCHPGAQKIMLLKQCRYLRIQIANALLRMEEALDNYAREADAFGAHNETVGQFDFTSRHDSKLFEDMEGVSSTTDDPRRCVEILRQPLSAYSKRPFRSTIYLVDALRPFHLIVHNARSWNMVYIFPVQVSFDLIPSPEAGGMDDSRKREAEVESIMVQLTFANFGTISSDETGEVRPLHVEKGIPLLQAPVCQYYLKKIVDESHSNEFAKWVSLMHSPPLLAGPYSCEVCGHDGNK